MTKEGPIKTGKRKKATSSVASSSRSSVVNLANLSPRLLSHMDREIASAELKQPAAAAADSRRRAELHAGKQPQSKRGTRQSGSQSSSQDPVEWK